LSPAASGSIDGDGEPQPWNPEPYQLQGVKFLLGQPQGALLLDPGYRKTSIVLAAFVLMKRKGVVNKLVVVGTPRICGRSGPWQQEVKKWKDFSHLRVVHLDGAKKEQRLASDADVYLLSYEMLGWLFDVQKKRSEKTGKVSVKATFARVREVFGHDTLFALDEASKVKRPTSQRAKVVVQSHDYFSRVVTMTGSPCPNGVEDLFGVMLATDGGYSLGKFITHFRNAYMMPTGYGGYSWVPQPNALERIYERCAPFVFRLDSEDLVKVPKLVTNIIKVDLPDDARRVYDELEEEFISEVEELGIGKAIIRAANSGSAYIKCAQVANGGIFKNRVIEEASMAMLSTAARRREWIDLHNEKTQAVLELLEELNGKPALVVYDFAHDLARLQAALGKDYPRIGSGVTTRRGDELIAMWNKGELPGMLVQASSLSHGVNMQEASARHVIWHSITTNFENYDQLIRRLRRSGSKAEHVTSHLIAASDTVDELKLATLRRKHGTQKDFLDAMTEYTSKRLAKRRRRK
jgi:hypothetical protein